MPIDVVTLSKVKKLSNPGTENVGRFLGVNSNGETVPMSIGAGQTIVDPSLATAGAAADAKAAGDAIRANSAAVGELKEDIEELTETVIDGGGIVDLFNKDNISVGKYLNAEGNFVDNPSLAWSVSEYINVSGLQQIKYSGLTNVGSVNVNSVWYDDGYAKLSVFKQMTGTNTVDVPDGAYYVRFSISYGEIRDDERFTVTANKAGTPKWETYGIVNSTLYGKTFNIIGDSYVQGAGVSMPCVGQ